MKYGITDKCERIIKMFENGSGGVTSVNGQTGDVVIKTFENFLSSWKNKNATMDEFVASIDDSNVESGRSFHGSIEYMEPMPPGFPSWGNIEVIVEVPVKGVYVFRATSTTTSPYHWEGTARGGRFKGWKIILNLEEPLENGTYALQCVKDSSGIRFNWVNA